MSKLAEVIASAFAGGLSWNGSLAGKGIYCPPPGLKGQQVMIAPDKYVEDRPRHNQPINPAHSLHIDEPGTTG